MSVVKEMTSTAAACLSNAQGASMLLPTWWVHAARTPGWAPLWCVLNDCPDLCLTCQRISLGAGDGDSHGVFALVNLDAGVELALQALDGITTLANDTTHNCLGALQGAGDANAILQ